MFGLPADINLSFFCGRKLQSIGLASISTIFHFDNQLTVTAESPIGVMLPEERLEVYEDVKDIAPKSVLFLGKTIKQVEGTIDGTLTLTFEDGSCLEFYDDNKQFEAYIINYGDKRIVV